MRRKTADTVVLAYLRGKAAELGRAPKREECHDGPLHPGSVARRFGGWKAALRAAGLELPRRERWSVRDREAAKRDVVNALRALAAELGRAPTKAEWRGPGSGHTVTRLFGSWAAALAAAGLQPYRRPRPARGDIEAVRREAVERLRSLAEELGRTPRVTDWRGSFGVAVVLKSFGTWNAALEAAGLKPNKRLFRRIRRRISDDEMLESLRRLAAELGRRPAYADLRSAAAIRLGCPCLKTLCNRFGSFSAALEAAGLDGMPRRAELRFRERERSADEAVRKAEELASLGFVLTDEAPDPLVRCELRKRGVPLLVFRGSAFGSLRIVLGWLRGEPVLDMLPPREKIREAMGERAFSFLERWIGGATFGEIGREEGLTCERVRQVIAAGAGRAVERLIADCRQEKQRRHPLLSEAKTRTVLQALLAVERASDPAGLDAAVAELEEAVHALRKAANSLLALRP
ncbi:MAG: homing endonuclease associated repeat-containing protein [Moorellales bacterium]